MDDRQVVVLAQLLERWEAEYERTNPAAGRLYWTAQRLIEAGMPPLVAPRNPSRPDADRAGTEDPIERARRLV